MNDDQDKDKVNDDDLFRQAMQDVEPLRTPARSDSKPPRKPEHPPTRVAESAMQKSAEVIPI